MGPDNAGTGDLGAPPAESPPGTVPPPNPPPDAAPPPPPQPGFFRKLIRLGAGLLEVAEATLRWLTAYPLFLLQLVILLLVSWGGLGADLGAEHLFWHERPFVQLGTGVSVGLLVGVLLFLNYMLFRPDWLVGSYPPDPPRLGILRNWPGTLVPSADPELRMFGRYMLWGFVFVLVVIVGPKLIAAASAPPAAGPVEDVLQQPARSPWKDYLGDRLWLMPFIVGYTLSALFALVMYYFDEKRRLPRPALRDVLLDLRVVPPGTAAPPGTPWDTVREYVVGRSRGPVPAPLAVFHGIAALIMIVALVILVTMLVLVSVLDHWVPGFSLTGLVSLVCLIFIVLSLLYGFFEFHFHIQRLTLVVTIGALLVWNSTDRFRGEDGYGKNHYKLQFPGLEAAPEAGDVHLPLWDPADPQGGRDVQAVLDATNEYAKAYLIPADEPLAAMCKRWQEQPGRENEKPRIVIVCTSGGGIRAAVWTGVVLHELEKDAGLPKFRDHVRMITGASGGMVGATLYVADFENPNGFGAAHIEALASDSLTRTGQSLILRDMVWNTVFVPPWKHAIWDRGRTLEWKWALDARGLKPAETADADWQNPWTKTFADLRVLERKGKRPSLVYSPLLVEDSRRLLISNLDLSGLGDDSGLSDVSTATGPHGTIGRSAVEFHRLFPDLAPDEFRDYFAPGAMATDPKREAVRNLRSSERFQVATAARMNATFPVISPAVSLPTAPPRRVVDAGIYDNYGVNLAALWMLKNRGALLKYTSGVALVQVRAFPLQDARNRFASFDPATGDLVAEPAQGDLLGDILASASAPTEAVLAARANAAYYRNAEQIEVLHRAFNSVAPSFFHPAHLELRRPAALNWYMTTSEFDGIKTAYRDKKVAEQHEKLRAWFGTGGKVSP